jgi:hypothetical protein
MPAYPKHNEGVMKPIKKQPTRNDLAAALITIRGQAPNNKTAGLQAEKIRRLEQTMGQVLLVYLRFEELRVN